jgi:hypothetical protein
MIVMIIVVMVMEDILTVVDITLHHIIPTILTN